MELFIDPSITHVSDDDHFFLFGLMNLSAHRMRLRPANEAGGGWKVPSGVRGHQVGSVPPLVSGSFIS